MKHCILSAVSARSLSFRLTAFEDCHLLSWVAVNCSGRQDTKVSQPPRVTAVLLYWRKQQGPLLCLDGSSHMDSLTGFHFTGIHRYSPRTAGTLHTEYRLDSICPYVI